MINLVVKESVANQHDIQNENFCPLFMWMEHYMMDMLEFNMICLSGYYLKHTIWQIRYSLDWALKFYLKYLPNNKSVRHIS